MLGAHWLGGSGLTAGHEKVFPSELTELSALQQPQLGKPGL